MATKAKSNKILSANADVGSNLGAYLARTVISGASRTVASTGCNPSENTINGSIRTKAIINFSANGIGIEYTILLSQLGNDVFLQNVVRHGCHHVRAP